MRATQLFKIIYSFAMVQSTGPVPEEQLLTTAGDLQIQGRGCWDAAFPDCPIRVFSCAKLCISIKQTCQQVRCANVRGSDRATSCQAEESQLRWEQAEAFKQVSCFLTFWVTLKDPRALLLKARAVAMLLFPVTDDGGGTTMSFTTQAAEIL